LRTQSFRLQIVGSAGKYAVHAVSPLRGEGNAPFVPPRPASLGWSAAAARHLTADDSGTPEQPPEAIGERLFAALFPGEILRLYEGSLDLLAADEDAGLRIELALDPRNPDLAAVQALPWELMREPGTRELLALNPRKSLVRYLSVPLPVSAAPPPRPLRILAVAANPRHPDLDPLDLERELRNLREAMATIDDVEIVTPERPTLAALRQALLDQECHALHFMGHGGSLPGQAERVLFLETEDGDAEPVRGTDLLNKLAGFPALRLAVLNACESAALPDGPSGAESFEPSASVANALVLGGLPAVIAMQRPISDRAAVTFSRALYQRLAAGDPVDAAVAEGRQAIHSAAPSGLEWATPVLFLRTRTGELFPEKDLPPEPSKRPRPVRWPVLVVLVVLVVLAGLAVFAVREARAARAQALVTEGAVLFTHGQWSAARDRFEAARKLVPGSAEVLSDLAGAEEKLGDVRAAEEHYREAARRRPGSAEHLYNLGHFLNGRRSYPEAYDVLRKAVALDPERADAYGELAQAAAGRGMLGRARTILQTALRLDPGRPALHRRLGELELDAGRPQAAIPHLKEARRYPMGEREQAETAALLIQAYDRLGDAASVCDEIVAFRRLDRPGITPWAPAAEAVATRRNCRASMSGGT
jgi:Tfp pilus assembly protein PilF